MRILSKSDKIILHLRKRQAGQFSYVVSDFRISGRICMAILQLFSKKQFVAVGNNGGGVIVRDIFYKEIILLEVW